MMQCLQIAAYLKPIKVWPLGLSRTTAALLFTGLRWLMSSCWNLEKSVANFSIQVKRCQRLICSTIFWKHLPILWTCFPILSKHLCCVFSFPFYFLYQSTKPKSCFMSNLGVESKASLWRWRQDERLEGRESQSAFSPSLFDFPQGNAEWERGRRKGRREDEQQI